MQLLQFLGVIYFFIFLQIEDSVESHSPALPTLPASNATLDSTSTANIRKYQALFSSITKRYQPKIALKNLATDKGKKNIKEDI